jgi:hypothetical protein
LSRGPDSSGKVWIGCKRSILKLSKVLLAMEVEGTYIQILKLSKVLLAMEVEGPYMHAN